MLGFETLTFAPIDRRLVDAEMLEPEELVWLNCYHAHVMAKIGPRLRRRRSRLAAAGVRADRSVAVTAAAVFFSSAERACALRLRRFSLSAAARRCSRRRLPGHASHMAWRFAARNAG